MAHGLNSVLKRGVTPVQGCKSEGKTGIGSRRIFSPQFKLQVLDSYRNDGDCKGNQRATARKYGIHRRQIQKWLQVENTLRNSVGNKVEVCPEARKCGMDVTLSGRQRDDTRVPAISPLAPDMPPAPLDFTTHSRGSPLVASPLDPAIPMDLSLKRPTSSAPVPLPPSPLPQPLLVPSPPSLSQPHPDVWDLSTKNQAKRKCEHDDDLQTSPKPPVKLFKPYLDDIRPTVPTPVKIECISPPCCGPLVLTPLHAPPTPNCESYYYNNNNNNNVCDIKSEYGSSYTLTELQPTSSHSHTYYYPFAPGMFTPPDHEMPPYATIYEDTYPQMPLKQRQSYSIDFKLQAIDSYYEDAQCKGNQRAVASKYNIHRRQVQKWLKQEEELRQRNESFKHIHAVR